MGEMSLTQENMIKAMNNLMAWDVQQPDSLLVPKALEETAKKVLYGGARAEGKTTAMVQGMALGVQRSVEKAAAEAFNNAFNAKDDRTELQKTIDEEVRRMNGL